MTLADKVNSGMKMRIIPPLYDAKHPEDVSLPCTCPLYHGKMIGANGMN
jgi:hypothetical protein